MEPKWVIHSAAGYNYTAVTLGGALKIMAPSSKAQAANKQCAGNIK